MIISWVQGNADPYFSPTSSITQVGKHLLKFQCPTPARCLAHNGRSVIFLLDKWHDKRAKWEKTLAMAASLGNHLLLWLWICDTKNKCKSISVLRAWVLPTRWICFVCSHCSPHILSTLMLLSPEVNVKSGHSCPLCLKGERKKLAEPRNQTQKSKVWNRFESRASSSSRQSEHISHFLFKTPLEWQKRYIHPKTRRGHQQTRGSRKVKEEC